MDYHREAKRAAQLGNEPTTSKPPQRLNIIQPDKPLIFGGLNGQRRPVLLADRGNAGHLVHGTGHEFANAEGPQTR